MTNDDKNELERLLRKHWTEAHPFLASLGLTEEQIAAALAALQAKEKEALEAQKAKIDLELAKYQPEGGK